MTSPPNLNSFLPQLLANGSLADLQGLINFSLRPDRIVAEIARSKRYEALPLFLQLLHLEENGEGYDELAKMVANELLKENAEAVSFLQQHLQGYVRSGPLAFYCGQLATSLPISGSLAHNYQFCDEYTDGLISADNLDLFLIHRGTKPTPGRLYAIAGKYCAKRCMGHFGYSSAEIDWYLQGSFSSKNQDTISHLFDWVEDKDDLREGINHLTFNRANDNGIVPFVSWLLHKGFLELTEKDWTELKIHFAVLYEGLQADV